jgi:hypothetical protein
MSSVFQGIFWNPWWPSNAEVPRRIPKWLHSACTENRFCHVLQRARNLRLNRTLDRSSTNRENSQFRLGSTALPTLVTPAFHLCVMKHSFSSRITRTVPLQPPDVKNKTRKQRQSTLDRMGKNRSFSNSSKEAVRSKMHQIKYLMFEKLRMYATLCYDNVSNTTWPESHMD